MEIYIKELSELSAVFDQSIIVKIYYEEPSSSLRYGETVNFLNFLSSPLTIPSATVRRAASPSRMLTDKYIPKATYIMDVAAIFSKLS